MEKLYGIPSYEQFLAENYSYLLATPIFENVEADYKITFDQIEEKPEVAKGIADFLKNMIKDFKEKGVLKASLYKEKLNTKPGSEEDKKFQELRKEVFKKEGKNTVAMAKVSKEDIDNPASFTSLIYSVVRHSLMETADLSNLVFISKIHETAFDTDTDLPLKETLEQQNYDFGKHFSKSFKDLVVSKISFDGEEPKIDAVLSGIDELVERSLVKRNSPTDVYNFYIATPKEFQGLKNMMAEKAGKKTEEVQVKKANTDGFFSKLKNKMKELAPGVFSPA